ncbi:MAG: hypothetical protein EOO04_09180 [Chitinophagaceae bacterium]|nr:MAG: hypothetical protein EOO04_09180 [Chitinophagaceae bacterium]
MSKQPVIPANEAKLQHPQARKTQPSPFIGAASIILGAGSIVLGVVGSALKGSVKLLLKATDKRKIETPPNNRHLPPDSY